ncbi:MAG: hypothetical protein HYZ58_16955 [Acidobacteria bacterium]|nr:hypothetical protein [Acidobacteriota bacterium]
MFLTPTALVLGFVHGLGADHLAAIAALSISARARTFDPSTRSGSSRASSREDSTSHPFRIAIRFALGHAALLTLGASAAVTLGWSIPAVLERVGEMVGGAALILLGSAGIWLACTARVYGHAHPRWHLHLGRPDRHPTLGAHTPISFLIGAAFAVGSLRALVLLAPFGQDLNAPAASLVLLLWLIVVFAVGIIISMSLFGIVLARVMSAVSMARVSRGAGMVTGMASFGLGLYWILLRS